MRLPVWVTRLTSSLIRAAPIRRSVVLPLARSPDRGHPNHPLATVTAQVRTHLLNLFPSVTTRETAFLTCFPNRSPSMMMETVMMKVVRIMWTTPPTTSKTTTAKEMMAPTTTRRVNTNIKQEIAEFERRQKRGDPDTGITYDSAINLMTAALRSNAPSEDEVGSHGWTASPSCRRCGRWAARSR